MKKSFFVLVIALVMIMAFSITVLAASSSDIIQALKDANIPDVYISQTESYMVDKVVSSDTADAIIVHINNARSIANGETKLSKLSSDQRSAIIAEIIAAAKLLDLTASYTNQVITVKDGSENTVFTVSSDNAIKQTGYDYSIILRGLIIVTLAGVAAIATKKILSYNRTDSY